MHQVYGIASPDELGQSLAVIEAKPKTSEKSKALKSKGKKGKVSKAKKAGRARKAGAAKKAGRKTKSSRKAVSVPRA